MDEKYIDIDLFKKQIFKNESLNLMTWMIEPNFDCVYMFSLYNFRKSHFTPWEITLKSLRQIHVDMNYDLE